MLVDSSLNTLAFLEVSALPTVDILMVVYTLRINIIIFFYDQYPSQALVPGLLSCLLLHLPDGIGSLCCLLYPDTHQSHLHVVE